MAQISLLNVDVDFPIYNRRGRSIKRALFPQRVGGDIREGAGNVTFVRALSDITLFLKEGERLALIGRNGSGKTTLLRILGKIYHPTRGYAKIDGRVSSMTDLYMGMDPEENGYENIRLRSIFLGLSGAQTRNIIADVEDFTELGEFMSLPIRTYSSGMLMRLCFAISTAIMPDIVVMDEIINVGDAAFLDRAKKRLDGMMEKAKLIIIATHDPMTAQKFCTRAILLESGFLIADGKPSDVWSLYQQRSAP